ncbi:Gfo/Idh/MocA family oxidoreductase [Streptococcaceae bacterium ESL0729]|nr:Gfo/Idh/MocA family oxidoreductase [Streptococcaceae bacterium ESL0729]
MIKLGIIGSSWISRQFIDAALATNKYEFTAFYSRQLTRAQEFTQDFKGTVELFDSLADFYAANFDTVYIASPNSLHYPQAKEAIRARKNVILEKPACSNPDELAELIKLSKDYNVFLFEAARNIHEKSLALIKDFLKDKEIWGADFTYAKYSSKMPELLSGKVPNIFSSKFSGGALADLGVYLLYAASYLFGPPNQASYQAVITEEGIDLNGVGILSYEGFKLALKTGKNITSNLPSEIYTSEGTLVLDGVNAIGRAEFIYHTGQRLDLEVTSTENPMLEEAYDFAQIILDNNIQENNNYKKLLQLAQIVAQTSYQMRLAAGIKFEADIHD